MEEVFPVTRRVTKLGIGIPTRDRPERLETCLRAIHASTFQDFQVVVVDNNHRDPVDPSLSQEVGGRLRIMQGDQGYAPQSHNRALFALQGCEYVLRLDDDIELEPDALEEMVDTLDYFPEAVAVGGCWIGRDTLQPLEPHRIEHLEGRQMYRWEDLQLRESPFLHSSWMYRRAPMVSQGGLYGGLETEMSPIAYREETLASRRLAAFTGKLLLVNPRAIGFHHWAEGGIRAYTRDQHLKMEREDQGVYERAMKDLGISPGVPRSECVPFRPDRDPLLIVTKESLSQHVGGVPNHAEHLKLAFPWAMHATVRDAGLDPNLPEILLAQQMGDWIDTTFEPGTPVICDGYWYGGQPLRRPVMSVCHGTWMGYAGPGAAASFQGEAFKNASQVVAVSNFASQQCYDHYGVGVDKVIPNGADLVRYYPCVDRRGRNDLLEFPSQGKLINFGSSIRSHCVDEYRILSSKNRSGVNITLASSAIVSYFSRYEGDCYALLEALACNTPIVTGNNCGRFYDWEPGVYDFGCILETKQGMPTAQEVRTGVEAVFHWKEAKPREWVTEQSSLARFIRQWRGYLS